MDAYLRFLGDDGRSKNTIRDAKYRDQAFIRPKFGDTEVTALTAGGLRQWRDDLVHIRPRANKERQRPKTPEDHQRRPSTGSAVLGKSHLEPFARCS